LKQRPGTSPTGTGGIWVLKGEFSRLNGTNSPVIDEASRFLIRYPVSSLLSRSAVAVSSHSAHSAMRQRTLQRYCPARNAERTGFACSGKLRAS
jgi:hypothetical protein